MSGQLIQLRNDNSDHGIRRRKERNRLINWSFSNSTALKLKVYKKAGDSSVNLLGHLPPFSKLVIDKNILKEDDAIFVSTKGGKEGDQFIFTPFTLRHDWKEIEVGAVNYGTDGDNLTRKLYVPISQVMIHNHYIFPVDVYLNGEKINTIGGEDGSGYLSNSRSIRNYNNLGNGFKLGDEFKFYIRDTMKIVGSISLDYKFIKTIHIGTALPISK